MKVYIVQNTYDADVKRVFQTKEKAESFCKEREIDMEHIVRNFISAISEIPVIDSNHNNLFNELEPDYEILNKGINK